MSQPTEVFVVVSSEDGDGILATTGPGGFILPCVTSVRRLAKQVYDNARADQMTKGKTIKVIRFTVGDDVTAEFG